MDYTTELEFAKQLGQSAYEIAQKYYKKNPDTTIKSDNSPVTIADEEINQLVIDRVKEQFPEHGVLGEEQSFGLDRRFLWVCDPIDGTVAFTMGSASFMFSLALVVNGRPVIAVVVNLSDNVVYHSVINNGSYINNARLAVSNRQLSEALLYFPSSIEDIFKNQPFYETLLGSVARANPICGGVFKGAAISEGLADGSVWLRSVHPWDMAAVALLVTEAGGTVSDRYGNADLDYSEELDGIIMSNKTIHEDLLNIVKETT
jgi:myo-inositol-1(or 4)-monophosphatase